MKRAAILSFSERGGALAERLADGLRGEWQVELRAPRGNLAAVTAELFPAVGALIFVGACGIAVRAVAPLLAGKTRDPAVVVVDERGRHAVSLLSGHIGGANALALRVAGITGGEAVITTATDVNGRFSVDAWAARHGLRISDMKLAKRFSAEILRRDLPLWSEFPIEGELPKGIFLAKWSECGAAEPSVAARENSRMEISASGEAKHAGEIRREEANEALEDAYSGRCGGVCAAFTGSHSNPQMGAPLVSEAERSAGIYPYTEEDSDLLVSADSRRCGDIGAAVQEVHLELQADAPLVSETERSAGIYPHIEKGSDSCASAKSGRCSELGAAFTEDHLELQADVPLVSEAGRSAGICRYTEEDSNPRASANSGRCGDIGAAVTCRAVRPFGDTLRLVPPVLHLGIGCKRGASAERIAEAVYAALDATGLLPEAVAGAASIDVKRDEPGLREFCEGMGIPIAFYSAEELRAQSGEFTASEFVERTVGVDNVCERAAMRAAGSGAKLLLPKRCANGVTVAIACADWRACFS